MAQEHLDRLTSIDAGFLHQEDEGAHMHIGGLGVFDGPAPPATRSASTSPPGCRSCRATARSC